MSATEDGMFNLDPDGAYEARMAQRRYQYAIRTVVVTRLPGNVSDEAVWSALEVDRQPELLERRLVRDPLDFRHRAAVLVFPNAKRAAMLAAALSLQLAATGCAAHVLGHYLAAYGRLESAHCVSRTRVQREELQVVVSNVNPNMARIPIFLENLLSSMGRVMFANFSHVLDTEAEYACGTEAQSAELVFDGVDMGGHSLSVKRIKVPRLKVPRFSVRSRREDQRRKVEVERQCKDVFDEFDRCRVAAAGGSSASTSKTRGKRSARTEDRAPVPRPYHRHALRLPPGTSRLAYVDQHYPLPGNFGVRRIPRLPREESILPDDPEGTDRWAAEVGEGEDVLSPEGSSDSSDSSDTIITGPEEISMLMEAFGPAAEDPETAPDEKSVAVQTEKAETEDPNVEKYFQQLDAWLRDMYDLGVLSPDFQPLGQYDEEIVRKQIFDAYMLSRPK